MYSAVIFVAAFIPWLTVIVAFVALDIAAKRRDTTLESERMARRINQLSDDISAIRSRLTALESAHGQTQASAAKSNAWIYGLERGLAEMKF